MTMNDSDQARERILTLDEEWKDAAARRDLDAMMAIYAPDARELLAGMPPVVGREAIRAFYGGLIASMPALPISSMRKRSSLPRRPTSPWCGAPTRSRRTPCVPTR
jgi:ketosteroid isomerase-like protein